MSTPITMPQLGETVTEGTVSRWLRKLGDTVAADEPLVEISTDKVDSEVPSPIAGTIVAILVEEDSTVPVGTALALIGAMSGTAATHGRRHASSPLVRRLARESGIDLAAMVGTGPDGRVTRADILGASTPSTIDLDRREPLGRLRRVIAERLVSSLQATAQLTTVIEVDVTGITQALSRVKDEVLDRLGIRLTLTAFFAKAAVEALRAHPTMNASIDSDGQTVVYHAAQHLGIAVDTPRGLMVPVVRNAADLNLLGLARRIGEVADQARTGDISPDDLNGATFTLTNTGSRGALFDTPILNNGQSGILGTGAVVDRVVVKRDLDGGQAIVIRSMVYLALTYDHRLIDGADAARFLNTVRQRLETAPADFELGATT